MAGLQCRDKIEKGSDTERTLFKVAGLLCDDENTWGMRERYPSDPGIYNHRVDLVLATHPENLIRAGFEREGRAIYKPAIDCYHNERERRYCFTGARLNSYKIMGAYWPELVEITCSDKKTPEQLAAEIKRRLLPKYLPAWYDHEAQCLKVLQHRAEMFDRASRLAAALGTHVDTHHQGDESQRSARRYIDALGDVARVELKVCGDSCTVTVGSVPESIAKTIIDLVREIEAEATDPLEAARV